MVDVAQVAGQYWYLFLLPFIAALAIAAVALYMLKRGRRIPPEGEEMERTKERLSAIVRERTAFLERANEELARSEEKYRTMIENSNDLIWTLDGQANFTYFNRRAEEVSGYGLDEMKGRSFAPLIPGEDLPRVQKIFMDTMAGKPATYEVSFYAKDGQLVALSVNTTPIYEAGMVVGTASFGQDITERKAAEENLRDSERRYRTVIETSNDLIWMLDLQGNVTYANRKALETGGFTLEDVRAKHFSFRIPEEDVPRIRKMVAETLSGKPVAYEASFYAKDGRLVTMSINTTPIYEAGNVVGVASFGQDITERKKAEVRAEYLSMFPEKNPNPIIEADFGGNVTYLNPAAKLISAAMKKEGLGSPLLADFKKVAERFARGGTESFVREVRAGSSFYQQNIHRVKEPERLRIYCMDITERRKAEELMQDYTDRLESEVKKRTAELSAEKDKVEALLALKDEFIRNVSHELKTPLSVIIGNLILLKDLAPAGRVKEWSRMVELLERNARRLGNSIDNVLELSIVSTEEAGREKVYLKDLLNGIYGQYAPIAELKGLKLTLVAEQAVVAGDAKMLRLAIANLVDNAIKFTEKGSVGIALKAADGRVSISVKDTGAGISAKDQKRLFEKFFKADPSAPGTGIGLAIAKEIVNKHNGEIRVKSALGKGSTFEIMLPRGVGK